MTDTEVIVDGLSDEELEDFTPIVIGVIKEVCNFSDKHNFDRNNMLGYLASRLQIMSEIATIENFQADKGAEEMSDLVIKPISFRTASDYVNANHRHHNAPQGNKFSIGVFKGTDMVGVAICGRPVGRFLDDGLTCEITRVCTDGTRNACSKLYGACCRIAKEMGYKKIITYILESEDGASVKASNFICEGEAGGTHWTGKRDKGQEIPHEMKTRWSRDLSR